MSRRSLPILATLSLAVALPAAAQASDPLLSGYGGPGAGEQVVLGGTTAGGGKGSGSGPDAASRPLKAQTKPQAPAPAPASSASGTGSTSADTTPALTSKPQRQRPERKKSSSSTSKKSDDASGQDPTGGRTSTAATLPGAPQVVAYPTRAGDVGGLPVAATALLLVLLGAAAATFLGLGLRRLSGSDHASDAQVSAG